MKVKIKTGRIGFFLPVPLGMAGLAVRLLPERVFEEMRAGVPEEYRGLITKEAAVLLLGECLGALRENRGLEILHVEEAGGTYLSVTL